MLRGKNCRRTRNLVFSQDRTIRAQAEFARGFGGFAEHEAGFAADRDELETLFAAAGGGLPIDDVHAGGDVVFARRF